jgi:hypothetical protein
MFLVNIAFCLLTLVLLTLVGVEAEYDAGHGRMLANTEIDLSAHRSVSTVRVLSLMHTKQIHCRKRLAL